MPSKAETICARLKVVAETALPGVPVFRDREDAFTREASPALLIEALDESSTSHAGGQMMTGALDMDELRVVLTVVVRGHDWQTVGDGVRVTLHAALMADAVLRSFVRFLARDRCEWQSANADLPFGYIAATYKFKYLTSTRALDAQI